MKVLTEFLGTFIFLFVIALAAGSDNPSVLTPLAIGGVLMVMVYMGGHRSGGHYNPAVSTGALLAKKLTGAEWVQYVATQIVAGILAFSLGNYITGNTVELAPGTKFTSLHALIVETIFTLALVLVVLNVACSKKTEGNSFYGLAIGFTIVVAAIAAGPISGGAFNPAIGIGATVVHAIHGGGTWSHIWIPIVGPLIGAVIAALVWSAQEGAAETA